MKVNNIKVKKAKILVFSDKIDSYVNVVAAIKKTYPDINEIVFCFLSNDGNDDFVSKVSQKLDEMASSNTDNALYPPSSDLIFSIATVHETDSSMIRNCDIIDVTSVSKKVAVDVAALAIASKPLVSVCFLTFSNKIVSGQKWVLNDDNFDYLNLFSGGALKRLYKNYFQKRYVICVLSSLVSMTVGLVIVKLVFPDFFIPESFISIFSLAIGVSSLFLAIKSTDNY